MLNQQQREAFEKRGCLMIPGVFSDDEITQALADLGQWSEAFLHELPAEEREWYLEGTEDQPQLRKLDNPVFHREVFRRLACKPELLEIVEQLIGAGVTAFFSQVFMKPPEIGGPKPIHQDNFYFGPDDEDAMLTVWVALDEATTENGCLYYGVGSHKAGIVPHVAPESEPFNLQAAANVVENFPMSPAPVPRGGVSLHHGNTLHQSSSNRSAHSRRAVAIHYFQSDTQLVNAALDFDESLMFALVESASYVYRRDVSPLSTGRGQLRTMAYLLHSALLASAAA